MINKLLVLFLFISCSLYSQRANVLLENTIEINDDGLQHIYVNGNELFVTSKWGKIFTFDVTDPSKPVQKSKFRSSGTVRYINHYNGYYYVADEISGLIVFKKEGDKFNNVKKIKVESQATWLHIKDAKLYLSIGNIGIQVYSLVNPEDPKLETTIPFAEWVWFLDSYKNYLVAANKSKGIYFIDINSLKAVGFYPISKGQINSFFIENDILYAAMGGAGVSILDISNVANIVELNKISVSNTKFTYTYNVQKYNDFLYLTDEDKKVIIYDISNVKKPIKTFDFVSKNKEYDLQFVGKRVFVASDYEIKVFIHNDAPLILNLSDKTVDENLELSFTLEASDPNDDALDYKAKNLPEGASFDPKTKLFKWTPNYEQSGKYESIIFEAFETQENGLNVEQEISISVNHINRGPSISQLNDSTFNEMDNIVIKLPAGTDPDREDAGKLAHFMDVLPEGATFDPVAYTLSWIPTYDQSGAYNFKYGIKDPDGLQEIKEFNLTINHVDRPPVINQLVDFQVNEDEQLLVQVLGSDPDVEDQKRLVYSVDSLPQGATFDAKTQKLTWTPGYEQKGDYKIISKIQSGDKSDTKIINVKVINTNRLPLFDITNAQTINENENLTFTINAKDLDSEDQGNLIYSAKDLPEGASFDATSKTFSWLPSYEQSGDYKLNFIVQDLYKEEVKLVVDAKVVHVNRKPVITAFQNMTIDENSDNSIKINFSDPDREDQNSLVFSFANLPSGMTFNDNSKSLDWKPSYDQSGEYKAITVTLSDGKLSDNQSFDIIVNHVNRNPIIDDIMAQSVTEDSDLKFTITYRDEDVEDKDKLSVVASDLPQGSNFDAATNTFSWKPSFEQAGTYNVSFKVTDSQQASVSKAVAITVNNNNRMPTLNDISAVTVDENKAVNTSFVFSDPDIEDTDKLVISSDNLPSGASISNNNLIWTPSYDQAGEYKINIKVSDLGQLSMTKVLTINVNNINRAPVLNSISSKTIKVGGTVSFTLSGSDPDSDALTFSSSNLPSSAQLNGASFTWTPTVDNVGTVNIEFTVSDGNLSSKQTATITINPAGQ